MCSRNQALATQHDRRVSSLRTLRGSLESTLLCRTACIIKWVSRHHSLELAIRRLCLLCRGWPQWAQKVKQGRLQVQPLSVDCDQTHRRFNLSQWSRICTFYWFQLWSRCTRISSAEHHRVWRILTRRVNTPVCRQWTLIMLDRHSTPVNATWMRHTDLWMQSLTGSKAQWVSRPSRMWI